MSTSQNWSSSFKFILVAAGSAVGLGNIWKFPQLVAENGGSAFILIYLACILLLGIPLLILEFSIGKTSKSNSLDTILHFNKHYFFKHSYLLYIIGAFLLMSFYFVVSGWTLSYFVESITGTIAYSNNLDASYYQNILGNLFSSPKKLILYTLAIILITYYINSKDIQKGIERLNFVLFPVLFLILIILIIKVLTLNNISEGLKFYFYLDFSKVTINTFINALGQTFFSLSLGSGTMIVYSSYLKKEINKETSIIKASIYTSIIGSLVGIFSGLIIIPSLFSFNLPLSGGTGVTFISLPLIFSQIYLGKYLAIIFFFMMLIATITSTISILETILPYFMKKCNLTRQKSALLISFIVLILSIPNSLSFNILSNLTLFKLNIFEQVVYLENNIFLTLGSLLTIIYGIYFIKNTLKAELSNYLSPFLINLWIFVIKFIIPLIIIVIVIKEIINS
jgi:NSS family neurotransmitter:Na+ symporter